MKQFTNTLKKQFVVIDGANGIEFIGDYEPAVECYKRCCAESYGEDFDDPEDVTVRFLVVMTSSQPEEIRDDEWVWVQGDPEFPRVELKELNDAN